MNNKYNNKFHKWQFKIEHDHTNLITGLSKDLEKERINDDFSNEVKLKYENPVQGENSKTQLVDALQQSDKGHDYYPTDNKLQ